MADSELIFMLNEIATKIPELRNKFFLIRLNHTSLIKAILSYCGVKNKHNEVCVILSSFKVNLSSKKLEEGFLRFFFLGRKIVKT